MDDSKYSGMTTNERLYESGLLPEYRKAVEEKNYEKVRQILRSVSVDGKSIEQIVEQTSFYGEVKFPYKEEEEFRNQLIKKGYKLTDMKNHPEAFGSWYCVYQMGENSIRLLHDGKEGELLIETEPQKNSVGTFSWKVLVRYPKTNHTFPSWKDFLQVIESNNL